MVCPYCRKEFAIPDDGLKGLPSNLFVEKLAAIQKTEKAIGGYCDRCSSREEDLDRRKIAIAYCLECREKLCSTCDVEHSSLETTRSHPRQRFDTSLMTVTEDQSRFCAIHHEEPLKFYCCDCMLVVCDKCFNESHETHKSRDASTILQESLRRLQGNIVALTDRIERCETMKNGLEKYKSDFVAEMQSVERRVCEKAEELKQAIERQKVTLLDDLQAAKKECLKQVEHVSIEIEQQVSLLSNLRRCTEELCYTTTLAEIGSTTDSLDARTSELLKIEELQLAMQEVTAFRVSFEEDESLQQEAFGNIEYHGTLQKGM